jgi:hypothetical protein
MSNYLRHRALNRAPQLHGLPLTEDSVVLDPSRLPLSYRLPMGALYPALSRILFEQRFDEVAEEFAFRARRGTLTWFVGGEQVVWR